MKNESVRAQFAPEQTQLLYRLERQSADGQYTKEETETLRKEEAYPLLRAFEEWLDANYPRVLPKSPIGQAIACTCNIYPCLARYVVDGRYQIDNNGAENGVRPLAPGRKNCLFCGNHQAAGRAAIIYSLLGTCKINRVNPVEWLTDVLNRINNCKMSDLTRLLPGLWWKSEGM